MHVNGHIGLVCVLWLDNIYFHMNVQSMLGRTGLSRFHFMLDIVLRHNTIRVENGLSDNRTCLPSKCLWGCAQLCYLYATLDFFSKKDGFKVEKCQSFVKVTKLYSSFITDMTSWNFPLVSEVNYFVSAEKYKLHTAYFRTTVCHKTSAKEILTVGKCFNQSQNSKK